MVVVDDNATPTDPIGDFITAYRRATGLLGMPAIRGPRHPMQRKQATKFLRWCEKHGVDPLLYLADRSAEAKRSGNPLPPIGSLGTVGSLAVHRSVGAARVETAKVDALIVEVDGRTVLRQVRPHQERFKSFYSGTEAEETCARLSQHSGGYNPVSDFCKRCTVTVSCIRWGKK